MSKPHIGLVCQCPTCTGYEECPCTIERARLVEQFEAVRECLTEFCAFDWHATQHIAGLQHDGHDLRAIHAEDIEKLKRVRMKATTLLTASNPASEPESVPNFGFGPEYSRPRRYPSESESA